MSGRQGIYDKDLANRLKEIRKETGLTQAEVAVDLSVTSGYISNVENGNTAVSLRLISYYAKMSGYSIDEIYTGEFMKPLSDTEKEIISLFDRTSDEQKEKVLGCLRLKFDLEQKAE